VFLKNYYTVANVFISRLVVFVFSFPLVVVATYMKYPESEKSSISSSVARSSSEDKCCRKDASHFANNLLVSDRHSRRASMVHMLILETLRVTQDSTSICRI